MVYFDIIVAQSSLFHYTNLMVYNLFFPRQNVCLFIFHPWDRLFLSSHMYNINYISRKTKRDDGWWIRAVKV